MRDFNYHRRRTSVVNVGGVGIGGDNPVRVQSMTNTSTMDTDGSVAQCKAISMAGGDIVRLTAQGVREADNIGEIRRRLREAGIDVPLVADIHFNPKAAFAAASQVEKVRINPGNFVDPGRTFRHLEYTDEEYARELERLDEAVTPFLELCRENSTAIRIGVNHGSLSDRIMSRYGDTPAGMVESAMEFLRICRKRDFKDVVISIKASNVTVMVETVRLLVKAMDDEGMFFPLHLGVTEAGDGEDGRVKSAVGIGALLAEGIGDTIRVSLSEPPENEIPVAKSLVEYISSFADAPALPAVETVSRECQPMRAPVVMGTHKKSDYGRDAMPDLFADCDDTVAVDAACWSEAIGMIMDNPEIPVVLTSRHPNPAAELLVALNGLVAEGVTNPLLPHIAYTGINADDVRLRAAVDFGRIFLNGFTDGMWVESDALTDDELSRLSFGILQAVRLRISRTEYIACPGCGRTLFDLQSTLKAVKDATSHLKGLKIGVMGCIVNGPGEMADADYGYVGAGVGRITLYKGKVPVERNIPAEEAIPRLVAFLRAEGVWREKEA